MFRVIICLWSVSYITCEYLHLPEGSPCSWQGVQGQCVIAYKCFSTLRGIDDKAKPPICEFQGKLPVICCTDCELVNDTRLMMFDPSLGLLNKTGHNKSADKCLDYQHAIYYSCKDHYKVNVMKELNPKKNCYKFPIYAVGAVGGRDAYREEFPHMALLGYGETIDTAQWLCGGSVISERFILTAAHCVYTSSVGPVKYVALGILKRSDPPATWQRYNVKSIIPHPEYKPPSKYHDIALLETDKDIIFSTTVNPACLNTLEEDSEDVTATGWGTTGYRQALADVLQTVYLHKFSGEECSPFYPRHRQWERGLNHSTQLCYGHKYENKDTCTGDSGGPLQIKGKCTYRILGVTSFGRHCGVTPGPGVYTRVKPYVPWIEDIVWP